MGRVSVLTLIFLLPTRRPSTSAEGRQCHDCGVTAKSGHVVCQLLGSRESGGFWESGGIAVRAGLKVGQVFGQARGTKSKNPAFHAETTRAVAGQSIAGGESELVESNSLSTNNTGNSKS
jgi:hypothetical protein